MPQVLAKFQQCSRLVSIECFGVVLAFFGSIAWGQESSSDMRDSGTIDVQMDIGEFVQSEFGETLIRAASGLMSEELGKDPDEAVAAVKESLGFDPVEQELRAFVTIRDIEDPLNGLVIHAEFKDSTGNLEGLLLAAPEYDSFKLGGQTIHTLSVDGQDVFIAFATSKSGSKRVVASASKDDVVDALKTLGDRNAQLGWSVPDGQFLSVKMASLPFDASDVPPPVATLTSMLDQLGFSIGEQDGDLSMRLVFDTSEEEKAMQLQQLVQGAVAMISLFSEQIREELDDEETASSVLNAAQQIVVERDGSSVEMKLSIPMAIVIQFLREEADLPL
ncbi:MAG: hypothetical protein AAFU85_10730 [Planctomycetota bacterium]